MRKLGPKQVSAIVAELEQAGEASRERLLTQLLVSPYPTLVTQNN
jgi:hypothetical protein